MPAKPPLIEQRLSFPVTAGQQQGMAEELIDPPELVKAWNVSYDRAGELSKRRGWHAIEETVRGIMYLPQCDRLTQRGDELIWIGEQSSNSLEDRKDNQLLSRVVGESHEAATAVSWERNGRIPKLTASKLLSIPANVANYSYTIAAWDIAYAGDADSPRVATEGVVCVAWQYTGRQTIDYAVVDVATGAVISRGTATSGASTDSVIRLVATKGSDSRWFFHLFYPTSALSGGATINRLTLDAASPVAWVDAGAFQSGVVAFDVCTTNPTVTGPVGAGDFERRLFFVYSLLAATNIVRCDLYRMSTLGGMSSSTGAVTTGSTGATEQIYCGCDPNGRAVGVVAEINTPAEMLYQFDATTGPSGVMSFHNYYLLTNLGISSVGAAVGWIGTNVVSSVTRFDNWFLSWCNSARYYGARTEFAIANGATSKSFGGIRNQYFATPYSRVFSWQGNPYQVVMKGNQIDSTGLEVESWSDAADALPWPNKEARFAVGDLSRVGSTARLVDYSKCRNSVVESWLNRGNWYFATPTIAVDGTQLMSIYRFSATDANRYETAQFPGLTCLSGGIPWEYDGDTCHESGFYPRPHSISAGPIVVTSGATSAPYLTAGDYYVAACWESIDSNGRVSRSAPSDKVKVTVGATSNISVAFSPYGETAHQRMRLVVYVSNDGGAVYYRSMQQIVDDPTSAGDITVQLDPTLMFQSGAPTLYSDSILANAPLPSCDHACEWQGRLWLSFGSTVWSSREVISGEAPGFNESMQFDIASECTGLASLDDRLVIFCRDRVYWLSGDGPLDTGSGGSFSQPQRVPTDFGCINARSIVRCEKGILFQSARGIELLGRGLDTRQVSGGIDRLIRDQGYSTCVASSYDPEEQIARFIMAHVTSGARLVLQWHHGFELWTVAQISEIGSNGHARRPSGLVRAFSRNWMAVDDDLSLLSYGIPAMPALVQEVHRSELGTASDKLDGYASDLKWYQSEVETANLKLDGLLGFVRCWRAFAMTKWQTAYTGIYLAYAIDYAANLTGTSSLWRTTAEIASGLIDLDTRRYMYGIHLAKQQCSAVRIIFKDLQWVDTAVPPAAAPQTDFTLVGFGLLWGQKPGTGRGSAGSKR